MVSSAQRTDGKIEAFRLFQFPVATQLLDEVLALAVSIHIRLWQRCILVVPIIASRRDVMQDELIQGVVIYLFHAGERLHKDAATDVHTYDIGDNLVSQVTCKADDTACPSMNIRHDADFAAAECGDSQQPFYLFDGGCFDIVREYLHVVILNVSHYFHLFRVYECKNKRGCVPN